MKKINKTNGVGVIPTPQLSKLRADLAVLDACSFMEEYKCSYEEYHNIMKEFSVSGIVSFLASVTKDLIEGKIKVEPEDLRGYIISRYQLRMVKLYLYDYEKDYAVCNILGHA